LLRYKVLWQHEGKQVIRFSFKAERTTKLRILLPTFKQRQGDISIK